MADGPTVLIVEAGFYRDIAANLRAGATAELEAAGVGYDVIAVPGVFEIPAAVRMAVRASEVHSATTDYAGFIALGAVIRGETDHYEHICREASRALMDIAVEQGIALGFGVLTCDSKDQADARANPGGANKGAEAARACLRMMELKKELRLARQ